jgi:hypothetical protein
MLPMLDVVKRARLSRTRSMTHLKLGRLSDHHRGDVCRDDFDGEKSIRFGRFIREDRDATMTTKHTLLGVLRSVLWIVDYLPALE